MFGRLVNLAKVHWPPANSRLSFSQRMSSTRDAAVCFLFCLLPIRVGFRYYAERNNPNVSVSKYYTSIPASMWPTLLFLSGECPLCDFTPAGKLITVFLGLFAVAIFAIPVGVIGSGWEDYMDDMVEELEEEDAQAEAEAEAEAKSEVNSPPAPPLPHSHCGSCV